MRSHLLVAAALVLSAATLSARASSVNYVFTGTADGENITLDFTTPSAGPYTPTVTSGSTSFFSEADNITIDGYPVGSTPDEFLSSTLLPGVSWIGVPGVGFAFDGDLFSCTGESCSLNSGTFALDLKDTNAELSGSGVTFEDGSLAVSETPEPSSIALLATGLLTGAGLIRRRVVA